MSEDALSLQDIFAESAPTKKPDPDRITAGTIASLLRARYPLPEWAMVFELRNGTGYSGPREGYADAAAWSCYPSKGLHRIAFEIKVSRADWSRELGNPMKRLWLEKHFHQTWFVTAHGVAKEEELPEGWGLLVATKDGTSLRVVRHAPHREYPPTAGPELAAMRSLAQKLNQERNKTYQLETGPVTEEQLRAIVEARCSFEHERANKAVAAAKKAEQQADDARRLLEAPIRDLLEMCGVRGWELKPEDFCAAAREGLRGYLEKAVERRLRGYAQTIEQAHQVLGALQQQLTGGKR